MNKPEPFVVVAVAVGLTVASAATAYDLSYDWRDGNTLVSLGDDITVVEGKPLKLDVIITFTVNDFTFFFGGVMGHKGSTDSGGTTQHNDVPWTHDAGGHQVDPLVLIGLSNDFPGQYPRDPNFFGDPAQVQPGSQNPTGWLSSSSGGGLSHSRDDVGDVGAFLDDGGPGRRRAHRRRLDQPGLVPAPH